MAIRHHANINQKINKFQSLISKYSFNQNKRVQSVQQPLLSGKKIHALDNIENFIPTGKYNQRKEESIRQIDDKISSIMKKHQKNQSIRLPLQSRNVYRVQNQNLSPQQLSKTIQKNIIKQTTSLSKGNQGYDTQAKQKVDVMKEQCRRVRERSHQIFENSKIIHQDSQLVGRADPKHYDQEIAKINQRIKQSEEKKKMLNIDFSPFKINRQERTKSSVNNLIYQSPNLTSSQQKKIQPFTSINNPKIEIISQFSSNKKPEKLGNIVKNKPIYSTPLQTSLMTSKRQLLSKNQPKFHLKNGIKQFSNALSQQIKIDEQFRNHKIWFTFSNDENKWRRLQEFLLKRNIHLSSNECRNIFQSSVEQHNPFFRWGEITFQAGLSILVNLYQKAQNHWQETILKKWDKQILAEELNKMIDDNKKSNIPIQNLVNFINIQQGSFYRVRDLWIIFKRLVSKTSNILRYDTLISLLTKE